MIVLVHGGALSIDWTQANMPAIVDAHFPGEFGGDVSLNTLELFRVGLPLRFRVWQAVAAILFGDVSPSGREVTTTYPSAYAAQRLVTDMQVLAGSALLLLVHCVQ